MSSRGIERGENVVLFPTGRERRVPDGSSWMMLIGGFVLLAGVGLVAWLTPPMTTTTLAATESIRTERSAAAGELLWIVIEVRDPGPEVSIATVIDGPSGQSTSGGSFDRSEETYFVRETGDYTILIQIYGRTVTIRYTVATTSHAEMALRPTGVPVALTGLAVLLGGLALRFVWRGGRGLWKHF